MKTKNLIFGNETDKMPDWTFRLMESFFVIYYFFKPAKKYLEKFGILPGFNVVDFGCGPGAFIKSASEMTGEKGRVYAVDIHELAIYSVQKIILKNKLSNVIPVLSGGASVNIDSSNIDLIYALDMFHMVKEPTLFLKELRRISKKDGVLILEDGHQPRELTKEKVRNSGSWEITEEHKRFLRCRAK
jgi:ubiquinone/menaquinone biosynthesis C-methylase UbiE